MTERDVYIAMNKEPESKQYVNEAFYVDDGSRCERALYKHAFGYVYFEKGASRNVPERVALDLLKHIQNVKTNSMANQQKVVQDINPDDVNN
jgi:hypothetical protein